MRVVLNNIKYLIRRCGMKISHNIKFIPGYLTMLTNYKNTSLNTLARRKINTSYYKHEGLDQKVFSFLANGSSPASDSPLSS